MPQVQVAIPKLCTEAVKRALRLTALFIPTKLIPEKFILVFLSSNQTKNQKNRKINLHSLPSVNLISDARYRDTNFTIG